MICLFSSTAANRCCNHSRTVTTDIDAMHKRGLRCRPVSVCPSVCHVGTYCLDACRIPSVAVTRLLVCSHILARSFTATIAVVCRRRSTVYRDYRRRTRSSWTRSSVVVINLRTYWNHLRSFCYAFLTIRLRTLIQFFSVALTALYRHDSTSIRRAFDSLSEVVKVTVT